MGRHCRTGRQGRLVSVSLRDICGVLCMLALCKSKGTRNLRAHLSMRHAAGLIHAHALRARIGSISLEHVLRAFACFLTWCGGCSLKARGFHLTPSCAKLTFCLQPVYNPYTPPTILIIYLTPIKPRRHQCHHRRFAILLQ